MNYVIDLLQKRLDHELKELDVANQMLQGRGFSMPKDTQDAFEKSREIAYERIPQLKEAIEIIKRHHQ